MKKIISLILALMLCLSLVACGHGEPLASIDNNPTVNNNSQNNNADADWLIREERINVLKFREVVEIVELTTANWNEHFRVYTYSYTEEQVNKDDFGEVVSTETITHDGRAFGAGNTRYHWYDNVVMELKDKATGELFVLKFSEHEERNDIEVDKDFDPANYECTRIIGSIYYLNFTIGELPVDTYLYAAFPEVEGTQSVMLIGALRVIPGTNAIHHAYLKEWLS